MRYTWNDASNLIQKYESGFENKLNYRYDAQHTASGYWQITDTNWRRIGRNLGIDINQYPHAYLAPKDIQEKVAKYMYDTRGFLDWAPFNPRLAKAIGQGEVLTGKTSTPTVAKKPDVSITPTVEDNSLRKFFILGVGFFLILSAIGVMKK